MTERVRWSVLLAAAFAATSAQAQTAQPAPVPPPAQAPAANAGSQGQSSTAQPGSPGASSQQVVVNPPQPVPAAPPSSTTVVNPPPAAGTTVYAQPYGDRYAQPYGDPGVVEHRREKPNPVASVALDGAYGGVAGLLVGGGVALIERDHWGRDLMVGAGLGLIVGAAVGIVQAVYDSQRPEGSARAPTPPPSRLVASDGLDRTDRDPVITARTVGLGFQF